MSAKTASLVSKILAVVILIGGFILKGLGIFDVTTTDIILISVTVAAVFATVDINILVDKLVSGKASEVIKNVEAAINGVAK